MSVTMNNRAYRAKPCPRSAPRPPIDLEPHSTYEALTRQMVESIRDDVREIKGRLNTLFFVVLGSILIDMVTRWLS